MREKLENVEGIDKIIFYPGKLIYQFELQLGLYVIPGQGGDDVATGFVHRIVNLARTFASQLRHPGELGEIISEIVNIRHSNRYRLNLKKIEEYSFSVHIYVRRGGPVVWSPVSVSV